MVCVSESITFPHFQVGMLTLGSLKINFQYESVSAMERLIKAVESILPEDKQDSSDKEDKKNDEQHQAYQVHNAQYRSIGYHIYHIEEFVKPKMPQFLVSAMFCEVEP